MDALRSAGTPTAYAWCCVLIAPERFGWNPGSLIVARPALRQVDGEALEIGERAVAQRALVGGAQHHARRLLGLDRFLPARRAQAPAVAGLEAGKAVGRQRCREIVAARLGKFEKLGGRQHAHRVAADVVHAGVAAAIAIEPRHRAQRARRDRIAEDVARRAAPAFATGPVVSEHRGVLSMSPPAASVAEPGGARWHGLHHTRCVASSDPLFRNPTTGIDGS